MLSIYISLLSYSVSFVKSDWDCLCFWFDILFICILFAFSQICYVFNSFFLLSFHLLCCPFLNTWVEWLMLLKIILLFENKNIQDSLAVQWLGLCVLRAWVQSLVRELRSHKPCGTDKGENNNNQQTNFKVKIFLLKWLSFITQFQMVKSCFLITLIENTGWIVSALLIWDFICGLVDG